MKFMWVQILSDVCWLKDQPLNSSMDKEYGQVRSMESFHGFRVANASGLSYWLDVLLDNLFLMLDRSVFDKSIGIIVHSNLI